MFAIITIVTVQRIHLNKVGKWSCFSVPVNNFFFFKSRYAKTAKLGGPSFRQTLFIAAPRKEKL